MARVGYIGFTAKSAVCCVDLWAMPTDTICYVKLADVPTFTWGLAKADWRLSALVPEELLVACVEISEATKPWRPRRKP